MLDRSAMIIEVLSTDARAPDLSVQQGVIRAAGIQPEKTLEFPEDADIFALALRDDEGDVVVISTPRAFGTAKVARAALEAMARRGVLLQVAGEDAGPVDTEEAQAAFLARVASTPWGEASPRQLRNPGRPPKRKQPTEEQRKRLEFMWRNPDDFKRRAILSYAKEELGRTVYDWELKHWFGKARGADAGSDE